MREQLGAWRSPPSRQDQLLSQLQQVQDELEQHQRENGRLKDRLGYVEACLALLDCEVGRAVQRRIGLGTAGDSNGPANFPLLRPVNRLNPQGELAGTAWPHGRKPQVSVWALPALGSWDATWDQHARELSTLDLVLLHRQALQEMAVMLPRAQFKGPASPDAERLRSLMDRYSHFNANAAMLAPEAWCGRTRFNLETLEPVESPGRPFFEDVLGRLRSSGRLVTSFRTYAAATRRLRAEYAELLSQHRLLLKAQEEEAERRGQAQQGEQARQGQAEVWQCGQAQQGEQARQGQAEEVEQCGRAQQMQAQQGQLRQLSQQAQQVWQAEQAQRRAQAQQSQQAQQIWQRQQSQQSQQAHAEEHLLFQHRQYGQHGQCQQFVQRAMPESECAAQPCQYTQYTQMLMGAEGESVQTAGAAGVAIAAGEAGVASVAVPAAHYGFGTSSAPCDQFAPQPRPGPGACVPGVDAAALTYLRTRTPASGAVVVALDKVLARMQSNLWRQRRALQQCLHAVWQGVREDCADIATGLLSMYPLLLDTADFMDVIADAGVRVPASQPAATHYVAS